MSLTAPFRCEPYLRPMPWGGRRLGQRLGKVLPTDVPYGESWEVSDHASHRSRIAVGPNKGQTLHELWQGRRRELVVGATGDAFPWLIKWLDCHDWLSVQVHPDDETATRLWPGERGKTEAWFILEADPGARIYAGLKPGVDARQLREAVQAGTVADCLHSFTPRPGDFVFLPAGTVHAVGGGVLMAEVQQTSDATFRLFDWNRRDAQGKTRELHVEKALEAIRWDYGPVAPIRATAFGQQLPGDALSRQHLVACSHFKLEYLATGQPFALGGEGRLQALVVVEGHGPLLANGEEGLLAGEVWIVPATATPIACHPDKTLAGIMCTLPQ